jgi:hypothetical protein
MVACTRSGRQVDEVDRLATDLVPREDLDLARAHVGGADEQLDRRAPPDHREIDHLLQNSLQGW